MRGHRITGNAGAITVSGRAAQARPAGVARWSGTQVAVGVSCGAIIVVLTALSLKWATDNGSLGTLKTLGPTAVLSGLLGALLIGLRPRNRVGWCFFCTGALFTVGIAAEQYAIREFATAPTAASAAAEMALWLQIWVYPPALIPFAVLVPLYFPDGRLPSLRWRPVLWLALMLMVVLAAISAFRPGNAYLPGLHVLNPLGVAAVGDLGWAGQVFPGSLWLSLVIAATTSLVIRFRRAAIGERAQIQWLAYAMVLTAVAFVIDAAVAGLAPSIYPDVFPFVQIVPVLVPIAATIAILRYRLFDIDRLINRTLLYGVLSAGVIGIYVVTVGGVGTLFKARPGNFIVPLVATGIVAVGFTPLRNWLQRKTDRLVYGDRADPYRALTMLGRRLEDSLPLDAVLPTVAATVADALRMPYVAVQMVGRSDELTPSYRTATERGSPPGPDTPIIDVPLTYGGEQVGRLLLAGRGRSLDLSSADRRVIADLGRQIGIAVQATQVEREARRLAADLQQSRERLVLAREEERRRIGRDLHDGLGPQLAGLTMTIEAARDLVRTNPDRAEELLGGLLELADQAIDDVRRIAHQLRPPALDSLGLIGALRSHAAIQRLPTTVTVVGQLPALPAGIEVAAYRIVVEAVRNVVLHAHATSCRVALRMEARKGAPPALHIQIVDSGTGFPANSVQGVGLASMNERASELGGRFVVEPGTAGGTCVEVVLPMPTAAPPTVPNLVKG